MNLQLLQQSFKSTEKSWEDKGREAKGSGEHLNIEKDTFWSQRRDNEE